jgi:hypothetical protein
VFRKVMKLMVKLIHRMMEMRMLHRILLILNLQNRNLRRLRIHLKDFFRPLVHCYSLRLPPERRQSIRSPQRPNEITTISFFGEGF